MLSIQVVCKGCRNSLTVEDAHRVDAVGNSVWVVAPCRACMDTLYDIGYSIGNNAKTRKEDE